MKKIYSIVMASLLGAQIASAQCSPTLNNFEVKLTQTNDHTLQVQMRYHENAVAGALQTLPTVNQKFDGMIVGITWPLSSNVTITNCEATSNTFKMIIDETVSLNKNAQDNIKTLFHNNLTTIPTAFEAKWTNDVWFTIANVTFSGKLNKGDYFSLLNCDYGLAHPNSYSGNSTTDPWFALMDEAGNYNQYSPKMITELPTGFASSFNIYPVPTSGEMTIDVEIPAATSAVVKVTDMAGRLMKTILFDLEKGKNTNSINIGELANGDYMIQLTDGKAINFSKQVSKR
jgi:Secretion system C-terminal sorting domain